MASIYDRTTTYTPARPAYTDDKNAAGAETRSIVDRHSLFNGTFRSARDLRVEGTVEGEIACEGMLVIAQGARVKATVTAREIEVAGELDGEVTCSGRFRIAPTGSASGKVTAASLVIEEGARFNGDFSMMREPAPGLGTAAGTRTTELKESLSPRRRGDSGSPAPTSEGGPVAGDQPDTGDGKAD